MGLFDNIFLDEEATTAVAEKPEEGKSEKETQEISSNRSEGEEKTPDTLNTVMGSDIDISGGNPKKGEEVQQSAEVSKGDTGVSFDIGGDIDIGGDLNFTTDTTNGSNISIQSSENNTSTDITPECTDTPTASFTVNGVAYAPDVAPETPNETQDNNKLGSIAMIQGSTAATGINIIDVSATEASKTPDTIEDLPTESDTENPVVILPQDDSLMNIISSEPIMDDVIMIQDAPIPEVEKREDPEPEEGIIEDINSVLSDVTDTPATEVAPIIEEPIIEVAKKEEEKVEEMIIAEEPKETSFQSDSSDITAILEGFIAELGQRETEINAIIIKRRKLAKRRMEIEEEHKNRLLAISIEEEYLRNKAERERAEQDKLQGVIKTFQKQIALAE